MPGRLSRPRRRPRPREVVLVQRGLTRPDALYRRVLYQGYSRVAQTIEDEDDDEDEKRALDMRAGE